MGSMDTSLGSSVENILGIQIQYVNQVSGAKNTNGFVTY